MILLLLAGCLDADGDGWPIPDDCDDAAVEVHPGAVEACNAADDDCDGRVDEDDPDLLVSWYRDRDGDGWGDPEAGRAARRCEAPPGRVSVGLDCDDGDPARSPGAVEVCNGEDDDCDGHIDDADDSTDPASMLPYYADPDVDGYGAGPPAGYACQHAEGSSPNDDDCDNTTSAVHPGAPEICNDGVDNDCDPAENGCGHAVIEAVGDGSEWAAVSLDEAGRLTAVAGGAGDLGADGIQDLVVVTSLNTLVRVRGGTREPVAELLLAGPRWTPKRAAVLVHPDWTGDGRPDLVVSFPAHAVHGDIILWDAGSESPADWEARIWTGLDSAPWVGVGLRAGDVDGDGLAELVIGTGLPQLWVVPGGTTVSGPLYEIAAWTERGTGETRSAEVADVDGDGATDLWLAAAEKAGELRGWWSRELAPATSLGDPDVVAPAAGSSSEFGTGLAAGDLDGDGHAELWATDPGQGVAGRLQAYDGATLFAHGTLEPRVTLLPTDGDGAALVEEFGRELRWLGDADLDGAPELLVASFGLGRLSSEVAVWEAPSSGTWTLADVEGRLTGTPNDFEDWLVEAPGDFDGDGRADLVLLEANPLAPIMVRFADGI